jgi:hypothetical protein
LQKFDQDICFLGKTSLRRRLEKIAENCDHNIDPSRISAYS